jgi:hypothetical protein
MDSICPDPRPGRIHGEADLRNGTGRTRGEGGVFVKDWLLGPASFLNEPQARYTFFLPRLKAATFGPALTWPGGGVFAAGAFLLRGVLSGYGFRPVSAEEEPPAHLPQPNRRPVP